MAPDVFSFFSPNKEPGAEPRASRVDQASTAETPGRLEFEVFDPHTTFLEPTRIEINRREERVVGLEARIQKVAEPDQPLAPGQTNVARLDEGAFGAMTTQLEGVLARFGDQTDRIAARLAEADRLAAVVSDVETRIATLEERKHSLTHAADRIAPGLAEAARLATVVSGVETRIATLLEREHSLTQAAERIGPGLAEADRLAAVVSRVKTRIAALLAREHSLTQAAEPIVGQALHDRADEPAAPFPLVSVDAGGSNGDGSRLGEAKRTIGRLAVATGVVGILALVVVGSGLAARWARPPVQAAVTQHKSEAHIATAASSPVLPSPAVDVLIPPAPTPLATAAPTTPRVIPAATKSASRKATSSKAATQHRARRPQPAGGDPSAPPVFVGALAVQSNPAGGTVFLDRQRVGETPLRLTGVTAGAHVIWIESPGHARWTAAVQVNTNKLVKVSATLEPRR